MEARSLQLKDYCEKSVKCLSDKVSDFFRNELKLTNIWIVDSINSHEVNYNSQEVVEVILFGDYINDFFSSGNWDIEKMRLWVLSESSRDVLCGLFNLEPEMIGVIPREKIFNLNDLPPSNIDLKKKINLVYGGRINEVKNCDFLLHVYSHLEKLGEFNLHMFGSFDEQRHLDRPAPNSFQEYFEQLLKKIEWSCAPVLHGEKTESEWLDEKIDNKVYINFSTYEKEDFSVSATQAAELSWPLILSGWGGHRGFSKTGNALLLRDDLIAKHNEPEDLLKVKSLLVAQRIVQQLQQISGSSFSSVNSESDNPKILSTLECDKLRREFISRNKGSSQLIASRRWFEFANQYSGDQALEKISSLMSERRDDKIFLIAVPGLLTNKDRIKASKDSTKLINKLESVIGDCRLRVIDSKFLKSYLSDSEENIEGSILFTADGSFVEL
jgi:hypothetical protein